MIKEIVILAALITLIGLGSAMLKPAHVMDGGLVKASNTGITYIAAPDQSWLSNDVNRYFFVNGEPMEWLGGVASMLAPDPSLKTTDPLYIRMGASPITALPNVLTSDPRNAYSDAYDDTAGA